MENAIAATKTRAPIFIESSWNLPAIFNIDALLRWKNANPAPNP
ncbi:MAG TPA: hypothetical protein VN862_06600 [Candidatus Acidoferrales bacterium]|nr:hypothetical protein [Candidatus Acidoferrales bacterium]